MAIVPRTGFKPVSTTLTTGGSCTISGDCAPGDFALLLVVGRNASAQLSVSDDSGGNAWSEIASIADATNGHNSTLWGKYLTAGDAGATITVSGGDNSCSFGGQAWGGVHPTVPLGTPTSQIRGGTAYATTFDNATTVAGAHLVVGVTNADNDNSVSSMAIAGGDPAAFAEHVEHLNTGGSDCAVSLWSGEVGTPDATAGVLTWSQPAGGIKWVVVVELFPAPAGEVSGGGAVQAGAADAAGVGASTSAGGGAVAAGSAATDGAGNSGSAGSGVATTQAATVDGVGASASTGAGALAASAAAVAGAGESASDGAGAAQAGAAQVAGSGVQAVTGTGALQAAGAAADGAGVSASIGSGALSQGAATETGSGWSGAIGVGIVSAIHAVVAAAGISGSSGAGALAAAASMVRGFVAPVIQAGRVAVASLAVGEAQLGSKVARTAPEAKTSGIASARAGGRVQVGSKLAGKVEVER